VPESLIDELLARPAIWRKDPSSGRLTGFDTAELRARLADLPDALKQQTLSLALSIEAQAMIVLMETHADS